MKFTTGEVISAGLGRLCCSMDRVYVIMNFLTGDNLFTHQLPRAFRACEANVKQQCPWLNDLNEADCTTENWREWLAAVEAKVGHEHELQPVPPELWQRCNPITEAIQLMGGKDNVVVVGL